MASNAPPGSATPATAAAGGTVIPVVRGVEYRCGDCGARNVIKGGDPVRCRQCGFRILYKTRTKRCMLYDKFLAVGSDFFLNCLLGLTLSV